MGRHLVEHGAQVHLWGRRQAVLAEAEAAAHASAVAGGGVHPSYVDNDALFAAVMARAAAVC